MDNRFNENLLLIKGLCETLNIVAKRAFEDSSDDGCRALYNDIQKDVTSYLEEIDLEIENHKKKGKWR